MQARKSIHLFDLDDTLITTKARILVRNAAGDLERSLTPAEFTTFRLEAGQSFDFKEFSDVGILSQGIVVHYTREIISQLVLRGTRSRFGILTARGDKTLHAAFLIRLFRDLFGIRLQKGLIFAVSDARFGRHKDKAAHQRGKPFSTLSVAERKALVVLEDLLSAGYNDISFYDDSRENLAAFRHLAKAYPKVVFKAHFIDPTWGQRLREFVESGLAEKTLMAGEASARIILRHHFAEWQLAEEAVEGLLTRLGDGDILPLHGQPIEMVCREKRYRLRRAAS
jgi:hypothetical protein